MPKHVWSKISNPVKYPDKTPVGSGPYTVSPSTCNAQRINYKKNTHYWQKGKPKIDQVVYPAYTDNSPANVALATGQDQWGGQYIPNIKTFYTSKSKDNHYWFPPVANVSIFINLKNPILKNVAVRRAMAYALNRPHIAKVGEYGYEPPGNQTGIVSPTFKSWLNKKLAKKVGYDPAKAKSILKHAGFKLKNGYFYTKSGKQLSFTMINIAGYTDWIASASIVQDELKKVGIKITTSNISGGSYDDATFNGHFELAYDGNEAGGPAPYYEMRQELYSQELRADRQVGLVELGALLQQEGRQAHRGLRKDDEPGEAALDRQPARGGDGAGHSDHPGHRGRGLLRVQHEVDHRLGESEEPLREALAVRGARLGRRPHST